MKKTIYLNIWVFLLFTTTSLFGQISTNERLALIDLYVNTNGSNWTDNSNWDTNTSSSSDVSTWFGVTTQVIGGTEYVTGLNLANNNLSGTPPTTFSSFTHLRNIQLQDNMLTGILPLEGAPYGNYDTVFVNNNLIDRIDFNGDASYSSKMRFHNNPNLLAIIIHNSIETFKNISLSNIDIQTQLLSSFHTDSLLPQDDIGAMEDLIDISNINIYRYLYTHLNTNQTGFKIQPFPNNQRITGINLPSSGLQGDIPQSVQYLSTLTELIVNNNSITHISDTIWSALNNLENVNINYNATYGLLEDSIYTLPNLKVLEFSNCGSDELNSDIGLLTGLEYLNFANNDIELIPTSIENLTSLTHLIAAPNPIASIPSEIGDLVLLEELNFSGCSLTNTPTELGNLINLKKLFLHDNQIQLIFPGLGNLNNLEFLTLHDNLITSLPLDFGNLIHLKNLDLNKNKLTLLPESIGRLDSLITLRADYNQLTSLPDSIGYLNSLEILSLDGASYSIFDNNITNLPTSIGNLSNLKELYLQHNQIDSIPDELNNLSLLEKLDISYQSAYNVGAYTTYLEYMPSNFNGLTNLEDLNMNYTMYQGNIDFSLLTNLKTFNAFKNRITGLKLPSIPAQKYWTVTENAYLSCIEVETTELSNWNTGVHHISKDNGVIFSDNCSGNAVPLAERLALIDLFNFSKHSTSTWNNWDNDTNSLSNVGAWQGVTTDTINGQKHVIGLELNNLVDTIPTSIQNLTQLKTCIFNDATNHPFNSLGLGFGNLNQLEFFQLKGFNGDSLPTNFGNLSNLKTLNLGHRYSSNYYQVDLTTLPQSIGNLQNLETFNIYRSEITALPNSIGNLNNLEHLNVTYSKLTTLPESIGRLDSLTELNLYNNLLTILPDSIGYMNSLEILNLNGYYNNSNIITNLPSSIGNLSNLKELYLQHNQIDSIPDELNNLSLLEKLDISYLSEYNAGAYTTYLEYMPSNFNGLTNLEDLNMNYTMYQGNIDFSLLTNLKTFNAYKNRITGLKLPSIPAQKYWTVTENTYLSCIEVETTELSNWNTGVHHISKDNGVIFSDNCSGNAVPLAERLALIDLFNFSKHSTSTWNNWDNDTNSLSNVGAWQGVTTDTINGQKHVIGLELNNLVDTIPTSIQNLTQLKTCIFNDATNHPFNSLGLGFGNLNQLEFFQLKGFNGDSLPTNFGNLSNLKTLNLGHRYSSNYYQVDLTTLPQSIGNLQNLETFNIYRSEITALPNSIGNLNNLEHLNVTYSKLTTLPESIGRLDSLTELNLSNNLLTILPDSIGYMNSLEILNLNGYYNNSNIITNLPSSIGNLSNLKELYLQHNQIDSIPDELNNLSLLEKLDISYLSEYNAGAYTTYLEYMPSNFNGLTNLEDLNMNYTMYQGDIDFSLLTNLKTFNAYKNKITGLKIPSVPAQKYWTVTENTYLSCIEVETTELSNWNTGVHHISKDNGVIFSDNCSGNAVPHAERLALIDLFNFSKHSTSTWNNWDNDTNSLSNVGAWQGVTTDTINGQKHVIGLDLNYLANSIPTSIQNLTQLKTCVFDKETNNSFNNLGLGFGNLNQLEHFQLKRFDGDSLPSNFGNLSSLKYLYLGYQYSSNYYKVDLTSLPESIGDLQNLKNLTVYSSEITEIPQSIGNLNNLEHFQITRSKLNTLPESIGRLDSVTELNLSYNQLTSLPDSIGYMNSLEKLNLDGSSYYIYDNNITSLPSTIDSLSNLKVLNAKYNLIDGNVDLSNLTLLETLYLDHNFIDELKLGVSPSSFGSTTLSSFNVVNNQIGCIEVPIDELVSWRLYTHYNKYDDGVGFSDDCSSFSHHVNTTEREALIDLYQSGDGENWNLYVYENHYDTNLLSLENVGVWYGVYVEMINGTEHVTELNLANKEFNGAIPSNIDSLTKLRKLRITNDSLTSITSDINQLTSLKELDFSYSVINDTLNLSGLELTKLHLQNTELSGLVLDQHPDSFATIYDFYVTTNPHLYCIQVPAPYLTDYEARNFNLNYSTTFSSDCSNQFTVPAEEKQALLELYAATNGDNWNNNTNWLKNNNVSSWHGITTEIVNGEKHITQIHLHNNNLDGYIPDEIGQLNYIKNLNLSYNNLSGGISHNLGLLDSLEILTINNVQATGTLSLDSAFKLTQLYMQNNAFNILKLGTPHSMLSSYYSIYASNNPNLTCIEVLPTELTSYQTTTYYYIPNSVQFTLNCDGPVLSVQPDTVYVNSNGNVIVSANTLDSGSLNSDSTTTTGLSFNLSDSIFDCSELGLQTVNFTVTDSNGFSNSDSTTLLVLDTMVPVINWGDTTLYLDDSFTSSINEVQLMELISDNCSIDTAWISQDTFTCNDFGSNSVTVTAIDGSNNQTSVVFNITIDSEDDVSVLGYDTTIYLNSNGQVNLDINQLNYDVTYICDTLIPVLSHTEYTCDDLGSNSIWLSINDNINQSDSSNFNVTVVDTIAPLLNTYTSNSIYLNQAGEALITDELLDSNTYDNCTYTLHYNNSLSCTETGIQSIQVWAEDNSGNISDTNMVNITVIDTINPIVSVLDTVTIYLDTFGQSTVDFSTFDTGSYDNCSITATSLSTDTFYCSDLGYQNIVISASDASNNSTSIQTTVLVIDSILPILPINPVYNVYLNTNGTAILPYDSILSESYDNCSLSLTYDSNYTCSNMGLNTMNIIATDLSGNTTTSIAHVNVFDTLAPNLVTNNTIEVYLNTSGEAIVTESMINNGTNDNCDYTIYFTDTFNCSTVGLQNINVWAEDASGNISDTNVVNITVVDSINPTLSVLDTVTIYLDTFGQSTVDFSTFDTGSYDNCSLTTTSLSVDTFYCSDLGYQNIEISALDASNNLSSQQVTVLILDTISPTLPTISTYTVYVDHNGMATLNPDSILSGSYDNCSLALTYDSLFSCSDLGNNSIDITGTDPSGNTTVYSTIVQVIDTLAPDLQTISTLDIYVDSNGIATVNDALIDNGTSDNCSYTMFYIDTFDCSSIGTHNIQVWAEDNTGNVSDTSLISVNVLDTILPFFTSIPDTVYLVCNEDILDGINADDNCGIDSIYIDPNSPIIADGDTGFFSLNIIAEDHSSNTTNHNIVYHISGLNSTIQYDNTELMVEQNNVDYQWYTCPDTIFISGANNQYFTPLNNGDFGVMLTDGECVTYSSCFNVQNIGINEIEQNVISLVPNPAKTFIEIINLKADSDFQIISNLGKIIMEGQITPQQKISIEHFNKGSYVIQIEGYETLKFIKL